MGVHCYDERNAQERLIQRTTSQESKYLSYTDIKILTQNKVADKYVPNEGTDPSPEEELNEERARQICSK